MKIIWIIILSIIGLIQISIAHDSSEKKILKNNNTSNTTALITEKYSKEISSHKHKKFVVTRKPPINYHLNKNTRIKKKYIKHKDTISQYAKKSRKLTKHVRSKIYKRKHHFKTKTNENIKKIFHNKIVKIDISNEDEAKGISAIVCKGIDIKNLIKNNNTASKGERLTIGHITMNYKSDDISKLRKCLTKLKKIKSSVSSEHKKDKVVDNKTFNALRQLLEKIDKSVNGGKEKENKNKSSLEEKYLGRKDRFDNEKNSNSNGNEDKENNNNLSAVTRPKRSVNIIEEERVATTSSGFTFTGRDLSINHQFTYRNIHY